MSGLKQKTVHDAGVTNPTELPIADGEFASAPRSSYAINETVNLTFTNKVVEGYADRLTIADGSTRPGHA